MHRTEESITSRRERRTHNGRLAARLGALLLLAAPSAALAQYAVPWESPQLLRPGSPAGISILYVDYGLGPFGGKGAALVIRSETVPGGFGLHLSAAHGPGDKINLAGGNVNLAAGLDASAPLLKASAQFPLDVIWTWGLGGSYGEHVQIAVPIGVAAALAKSSSRLIPYASARAVAEGRVGS